MKTFFGVLKEGVLFSKISKKLEEKHDLKIVKYYPKLRIVKLEAKKMPQNTDDYFKNLEEERSDFTF